MMPCMTSLLHLVVCSLCDPYIIGVFNIDLGHIGVKLRLTWGQNEVRMRSTCVSYVVL